MQFIEGYRFFSAHTPVSTVCADLQQLRYLLNKRNFFSRFHFDDAEELLLQFTCCHGYMEFLRSTILCRRILKKIFLCFSLVSLICVAFRIRFRSSSSQRLQKASSFVDR